MNVDALLFDFDGVIVETMPYHLPAWQTVLENECGFTPDELTIRKNEGRQVLQMGKAIFEHAHVAFTKESIKEVVRKKNQVYLLTHKAHIFPHVLDIIDWGHHHHLKIGMVTGSPQGNLNKIVEPEILQRFDYIVTGDSTINGKPAPDPYLRAATHFAVQPDRCLVIENAPLGIESAKSAGMTCYALETTLPAHELAEADYTFATHEALLNYLDKHHV